jgi:diaminohydroxyphosphoribosylaminopyrimidine deaminase/5-amino-6-(5-phosphoribosylamino)uracil reductase
MSAPPNPWVGCVVVDPLLGDVVGRGFHSRAGGPHAEIEALRDAASRRPGGVAGCTAYVTLEPCHHTGKTGPCDVALMEAGISRVVVCVQDPDSRVAGEGIAALRRAGVEVTVGVCRADGERLLAPCVSSSCLIIPPPLHLPCLLTTRSGRVC